MSWRAVMLYANSGQGSRGVVEAGPHAGPGLEQVVWFDLLNPTDAERSLVERVTGLRVPALADMSEIESSSRLAVERGVLYLSAPTHLQDAEGVSHSSPIGFVLSKDRLLTVRFTESPVFQHCSEMFPSWGESPSSVMAFLGLLEAIVDRLADVLEHIGAGLDLISRRVFKPDGTANPSKADLQLRATLRSVGRSGERLSNLRDSLLGVQRVVLFAAEVASAWTPAEHRPRFATLRQDIASLSEYDNQLTNKVQFLLDATLGFINIEQNNGIKVLTVVSVVGVPPTLMASIYGMNFKNMPELDWHYGYAYGLTMIVASAVIPLIWFKVKGWI